ncbi:hypothetical protein DRO55_04590 [Candidatus Bathyarchaeota archaeon]|nr:MAG: hypothetical protein DRO55_04590 [Candidatus Bathyarchaeota archaeon]
MRIRAVTFDLWNTLISEGEYVDLRVRYLHNLLLQRGYIRTYEDVYEAYNSSHEYAHRVTMEENNRHVPAEERIDYILRRLNVKLTPEMMATITKRFEEAILEKPPPLLDGVEETLNSLKGRYLMGIISDTGITPGRVMRRLLKRLQILEFFDSTVFSDEVGFNKPHRVIFERALKELGVKPQEVIHVGDLLQTDIAGAKSMGITAVWLNRDNTPQGPIKPDYEITALPQLINILNRTA